MTPAGHEESKDYLNALIASFLGWTLDAFDFFVLVFAIPTIAEEFHVDLTEIAKTIAVTLAFRPVGAFIFGLLADRYGRPMFFIGGLPALLALFVRFKVKESAVWERTRPPNWSGVGRAIVSQWKLFLYLSCLMMMMNFASHGTQDMYPTFLKLERGFSPR